MSAAWAPWFVALVVFSWFLLSVARLIDYLRKTKRGSVTFDLRRENDRQRKDHMDQWISVDDRLPVFDQLVWAWGDLHSYGDSMFLAKYDPSIGIWYQEWDVPVPGNDVRFWRPVPAPPPGCDWNVYPKPRSRSQS